MDNKVVVVKFDLEYRCRPEDLNIPALTEALSQHGNITMKGMTMRNSTEAAEEAAPAEAGEDAGEEETVAEGEQPSGSRRRGGNTG